MAAQWLTLNDSLIGDLKKTDPLLSAELAKIAETTVTVNVQNVLTEFRAWQRQLSKKTSASIAVSPFFKGDGNFDDFSYSYFAGGFTDKFRFTPLGNSSIIAERYGFGIEINLAITKIKSSLHAGFMSIAAAVQMDLAEANYNYTIKALPQGEFYQLLPPIGKFDIDAIKKFHDLVVKLKELYNANINIPMVAIEVLKTDPVKEDGTENARSYYFAAKKILERKSLRDAVLLARQAPPKNFNEDAIQYFYSRSGLSSLEETPSTLHMVEANKLINA